METINETLYIVKKKRGQAEEQNFSAVLVWDYFTLFTPLNITDFSRRTVILPQRRRLEGFFCLYSFTAMSHCAVQSAQGQKMRSLVGMPVLQVVQHVSSLEQLCVESSCLLPSMNTSGENIKDKRLCHSEPCHLISGLRWRRTWNNSSDVCWKQRLSSSNFCSMERIRCSSSR